MMLVAILLNRILHSIDFYTCSLISVTFCSNRYLTFNFSKLKFAFNHFIVFYFINVKFLVVSCTSLSLDEYTSVHCSRFFKCICSDRGSCIVTCDLELHE